MEKFLRYLVQKDGNSSTHTNTQPLTHCGVTHLNANVIKRTNHNNNTQSWKPRTPRSWYCTSFTQSLKWMGLKSLFYINIGGHTLYDKQLGAWISHYLVTISGVSPSSRAGGDFSPVPFQTDTYPWKGIKHSHCLSLKMDPARPIGTLCCGPIVTAVPENCCRVAWRSDVTLWDACITPNTCRHVSRRFNFDLIAWLASTQAIIVGEPRSVTADLSLVFYQISWMEPVSIFEDSGVAKASQGKPPPPLK